MSGQQQPNFLINLELNSLVASVVKLGLLILGINEIIVEAVIEFPEVFSKCFGSRHDETGAPWVDAELGS
jgi:hypothetical protein